MVPRYTSAAARARTQTDRHILTHTIALVAADTGSYCVDVLSRGRALDALVGRCRARLLNLLLGLRAFFTAMPFVLLCILGVCDAV